MTSPFFVGFSRVSIVYGYELAADVYRESAWGRILLDINLRKSYDFLDITIEKDRSSL